MQSIRRRLRAALFLAALAALAWPRGAACSPADGAPSGLSGLEAPVFSPVVPREGPAVESVSCIAQDARGFIWLGTRDGLVRYDGSAFKLFEGVSFEDGSLGAAAAQAPWAGNGAVWVGSLPGDTVTALARDGRGRLWVGTNSGLYLLDGGTGRFRRFLHDPADPSSLPSDCVTILAADRSGELWIGGVGMGLAHYDEARGSFVAYRVPSGGDATAIAADSAGRLWVGFSSGGVAAFDPGTGRFGERSLGGERVRALAAGEHGKLFVGTRGDGLLEYSAATGRVARYRKGSIVGSLTDDDVLALFMDRAGDLWIGTESGGLCVLGRENRGWASIPVGGEGTGTGEVFALLSDRRGRIWVGSHGGGIARLDPASGAWRRYSAGSGLPGTFPGETADFLREDGRGTLWAGLDGLLLRYDEASDRFAEVPIPPAEARGQKPWAEPYVCAMADDPAGGAWIGTAYSGLIYWDRGAGTFRRFGAGGGAGSLSDGAVTALGRDAAGRLWVGTSRGLNRLDTENGARGGASFVGYRSDPAKGGGIASDSIRAIFLDSRKSLWIGTGGGLMRYEPETDSFMSYTARDGLPGNAVLSILEDRSGNLWIATQAGLAIYDHVSGRFRSLSIRGGGNCSLYPGACAAGDGSLLFGSAGRFLRFDPGRYEFNDRRPFVVLTSLSVGDGPEQEISAPAVPGMFDLPRGEASVSLSFAALDYDDPSRNLFSYRLEGFDKGWSVPSVAHRASYTNLPAGSYVFRVKACNDDGLWNEEGVSFRFRVRRWIWASVPALVLYALALLAAGWGAARRIFASSLASLRAENERLRTKLVAASAAIESAAIVDPLTGLPNRRKILEHLELAISRASRSKLDVAVLMVDIDHFKSYNDRFGKAAGNECLRKVGRSISTGVRRSSDVVARYGGEEFLVVMEKTSVVGALSEAETIRQSVEALGEVTVSVGCIAVEPGQEASPATVIAAAEKALMAAKMLGRNRISV